MSQVDIEATPASTAHGKSRPTASTDIISSYAGVTQLVEFQPSKLAVAGSSPVSRS